MEYTTEEWFMLQGLQDAKVGLKRHCIIDGFNVLADGDSYYHNYLFGWYMKYYCPFLDMEII